VFVLACLLALVAGSIVVDAAQTQAFWDDVKAFFNPRYRKVTKSTYGKSVVKSKTTG